MPLPSPRATFAAALSLCLTASAYAQNPAPATIRVVACDQPVQSTKRGVCANQLSEADFRALAPGVSWFYNWHYESKDLPPAGVPVEFVPMAWGDRPADVAGLQAYLARTPKKPRAVLAIIEPNLRDQAFISPQQTANLYKRIKEVADRYSVPTVGPHMALGSADKDSIKAMDPVQHKEITYTFMVPFLEAVFNYLGTTPVTATAFHSYGAYGELKWAVGMMHDKFQKPVWVTEYAQWNAGGPDNALKYTMQATDLLERSPNVAGYAWFKERVDKNPAISLFTRASGELTPIGQAYVHMPVHDANVYYRLPGRLQAESYVAMDKMEIQPTKDTDGFAFMGAEEPQGWLEYNVQVDAAGPYVLRFRVGGAAGKLEILQGNTTAGQVQGGGPGGWQTVETSLNLTAGPQKLRVRCENSNQAINWIEFARK